MFFESWSGLLHIGLVGLCAYAALVLLVRLYGKRSLARMNAFDLVVNVALGSVLAATILDRSRPWIEGIFALFVLLFLQFALTWCSARWERFRNFIAGDPSEVVRDGELLHGVMRSQRVAESEIMHALREAGLTELKQAKSVVLETDGRFSVIKQHPKDSRGPEDPL